MIESITIDGLECTKSNHKLRYNLEFHEDHRKPFIKDNFIYTEIDMKLLL
ncbi:hypothetical protein [Clostridium sporogenes]|nr:hypothetical protein [Clostridium sporogenes]